MAMRNACITAWKFVEEPDKVPFDDSVIQFAVWQREKCPETGRRHLQMYAEAKKPLTLNQWKASIGDATAHIEKRRGTRDEAVRYCQKPESRDEDSFHTFGQPVRQGQRRDVEEREKRIAVTLSAMLEYSSVQAFLDSDDYAEHEIFYNLNEALLNGMYSKRRSIEARKRKFEWWEKNPLYKWQQEVVNICEAPADDRRILWLWSAQGNRGKSRVAEYLRVHHGAIELGGKADACRFAYDGQPIVIFDISASQQDYVQALYGVAEQLKNGCVFSSKYVSVSKIFDPPHVLFISNFAPPLDAWKEARVIELQVPPENSQCIIRVDHL